MKHPKRGGTPARRRGTRHTIRSTPADTPEASAERRKMERLADVALAEGEAQFTTWSGPTSRADTRRRRSGVDPCLRPATSRLAISAARWSLGGHAPVTGRGGPVSAAETVVDFTAARADHVAFLTTILGDPPDGPVNLFALDTAAATGEVIVRWADTAHDLYKLAETLPTTCNVWFGVATRRERLPERKRGGAEDCLTIGAVWVDLDVNGPGHARGDLIPTLEDAYALVEGFPLRPTAVVDTGDGLQVWWALTERLTVAEADALLAQWATYWTDQGAERGWHIDDVFDAARIMRMPGFTNPKTQPAPAVELVAWNPHLSYGVDDLDPLLPEPKRPDPPPERPPYDGPARPGDHYNATHRPGDVLLAHGWTEYKIDRNGDEHYTRPGKPPPGPLGHCVRRRRRLRHLDHGAPPLRQRGCYDAFGLYAHLAHGGDFVAAGRALRAEGYGEPPDDGLGDPAEWGRAGSAAPSANGQHPGGGQDGGEDPQGGGHDGGEDPQGGQAGGGGEDPQGGRQDAGDIPRVPGPPRPGRPTAVTPQPRPRLLVRPLRLRRHPPGGAQPRAVGRRRPRGHPRPGGAAHSALRRPSRHRGR